MNTIIRNTQGSSRQWCRSKNVYVYSAVVNNGPGPVSSWSLYIGPLWPNKYWSSYNRNHNSVAIAAP